MRGIRIPLQVGHRCSNGGITDRLGVDHVTLIEIDARALGLLELNELAVLANAIRAGMQEPDETAPAVRLLPGNMPRAMRGRLKLVPVDPHPALAAGRAIGPMMGGSHGDVPAVGMVPLHDRWETPAQYEALSR